MPDARSDKFIPAAALDALLRAHDGDVALLYLYLLSEPGADMERAAVTLCRTLQEVDAAWEKLRRMGLTPGEAPPVTPTAPARQELLPPAEELPQYPAAELSRRGREDPAFAAILEEAAKVIGRNLNSNDMRILFGVYDHLGLPAEVILELLNYVGQVYREKYGEGRRPTARAIEKEAYTWVNQELLTLDQAEAYIHKRRQLHSDLGRIQALLGIRGRELREPEQKYIEAWLAMGFPDEALSMALDRTVVKTGKLSWKYMDAILQSWHQKGLHQPREIEEKDGFGRKAAPARPAGKDKPVSIEDIKGLVGKI
ncbi:MAG: DnaD domain protein [Oscillospiraceae bacterium]|nr:DnaD domain protein [Oscillospiraceae bacterium]